MSSINCSMVKRSLSSMAPVRCTHTSGGGSNGLTGKSLTLSFDVYYDITNDKMYCDNIEDICKAVCDGTAWRESVNIQSSSSSSALSSISSGLTPVRILNVTVNTDPASSTYQVIIHTINNRAPEDLSAGFSIFNRGTVAGVDMLSIIMQFTDKDKEPYTLESLTADIDVSSFSKTQFTFTLYA